MKISGVGWWRTLEVFNIQFGVCLMSCCQAWYPRFESENLEKNKVLFERVALLAKKHDCTPGQLALAWLMHQGENVVPIPGLHPTFFLTSQMVHFVMSIL